MEAHLTDCQRVLNDFSTVNGVPLSQALDLAHTTPAAFLDQLRFVDVSSTIQCQKLAHLAAYTAPGHTVIYVCGNRFAKRFANNPRAAEMIVIHEMLHAVGLGENPPTSAAITEQVARRCGSD